MPQSCYIYCGKDWLTKYAIDGRAVVMEFRLTDNNVVGRTVAPPEAVLKWPTVRHVDEMHQWLKCEGPARLLSPVAFADLAWKLVITKCFALADLPEVNSSELPSGLLTNPQISERYRDDLDAFYDLANKASRLLDVTEKRRFMSLEANRKEQDSIE